MVNKVMQAADAMSSDTEQEFVNHLKEAIEQKLCLNATWSDVVENLACLVEPAEERSVKKNR